MSNQNLTHTDSANSTSADTYQEDRWNPHGYSNDGTTTGQYETHGGIQVKSGPEGGKMPETVMANDPAPAGEAAATAAGVQGGAGPGHVGGAGPAGPSGAGEPPGGKPKLKKFAYGFWSPEVAMFRKIVLKILVPASVLLIILMWTCLPLYWGSLWETNVYTNHLTVKVINRDNGVVGQNVSAGLLAYDLRPALGYVSVPSSDLPTEADVENDVVEEGAWAIIVIQEGSTDALLSARQNGNSSYNGSQAIQVYYAQGRSENAENAYLVPYLNSALGMITGQFNARSDAQYFAQNSGNATAMALLSRAPQTLSQPIFYTMNNIRPYNEPVATAITLVGLIYMLIFSFIFTMANAGAREVIAPFLTTRSYIMYRIFAPLIAYLPLSFFFAMVSLPFKVNFGAHYTYAGGFFLWAFTLYLGMASVGLATEFAITVLGPKFTGFFLIPLIISNVSVLSFPHELQPWIFRYGVAMPFYQVNRVVRTIIFNTKNDIAMNMGILLAWIVLSIITISVATWLFRRKSVNEHRKAIGGDELDEKLPA